MKNIFKRSRFLLSATALLAFAGCATDSTPPVLTLNGAETMTIYKGDVFTDPGATAIDDKDGDITDQITVSGTVGTDVDNYALNYSVTDSRGNLSSETRSVLRRYGNAYLAGTYSVVETTPFGSDTYNGTITADSGNDTDFVFGSLSAANPLAATASIGASSATPSGIELISVTQGGPITNFSASINDVSGVVLTFSYIRPDGSGTTTNCNATWTKQ